MSPTVMTDAERQQAAYWLRVRRDRYGKELRSGTAVITFVILVSLFFIGWLVSLDFPWYVRLVGSALIGLLTAPMASDFAKAILNYIEASEDLRDLKSAN